MLVLESTLYGIKPTVNQTWWLKRSKAVISKPAGLTVASRKDIFTGLQLNKQTKGNWLSFHTAKMYSL